MYVYYIKKAKNDSIRFSLYMISKKSLNLSFEINHVMLEVSLIAHRKQANKALRQKELLMRKLREE